MVREGARRPGRRAPPVAQRCACLPACACVPACLPAWAPLTARPLREGTRPGQPGGTPLLRWDLVCVGWVGGWGDRGGEGAQGWWGWGVGVGRSGARGGRGRGGSAPRKHPAAPTRRPPTRPTHAGVHGHCKDTFLFKPPPHVPPALHPPPPHTHNPPALRHSDVDLADTPNPRGTSDMDRTTTPV